MRRIFGILFIGVLCAFTAAWAEEAAVPHEPSERVMQIKDMLHQTLNDDDWIREVQETPYEYRQYWVPALHTSRYTSQKVRTHPDIIVWKGKMPTRIAPQLEKWARENLEYLPPDFYPALMPEAWPTPAQMEKTRTKTALEKMRETEWKPNPNSVLRNLDGPRTQAVGAPLTAADFGRLPATLKDIDAFYRAQKMPEVFLSDILNTPASVSTQRHVSFPFETLLGQWEKMGITNQMNAIVQKNGWKDVQEFANKTDRMVKAYRANLLNPIVAVELYKIRRVFPEEPEDMGNKGLWMYAEMYRSNPEDIKATAPHMNKLRHAFRTKNMVKAGTFVFID